MSVSRPSRHSSHGPARAVNSSRTSIAGWCALAYVTAMASALLRILMLVALALMPLGMTGAAAAAAPSSAAAAGHCDDHQKPVDAPAKMDMHCATCAALPVVQPNLTDRGLRPELPRLVKAANALSDTEPETDTPPPRLF